MRMILSLLIGIAIGMLFGMMSNIIFKPKDIRDLYFINGCINGRVNTIESCTQLWKDIWESK